jgi:hypothetical protein
MARLNNPIFILLLVGRVGEIAGKRLPKGVPGKAQSTDGLAGPARICNDAWCVKGQMSDSEFHRFGLLMLIC